MRRCLVHIWLALLVVAAAPAHAEPDMRTLSLLITRTTTGASDFSLGVFASVSPQGAFIGEADLTVTRGRVQSTSGGAVVSNNPSQQGLRAGPLRANTCEPTLCDEAPDGVMLLGTSYSSRNSRGDVNAVLVVARAHRISYTFKGHGWSLRRLPLTFRAVELVQASEATASLGTRGVALFTGATAAGGKRGSVAVAVPPCSISDIGVASRGAGRVELLGGVAQPSFTCPTDQVPIASYARAATTWRLQGIAAGDSTLAQSSLLVIDLPPQMPAAAP